MKEDYSQLLETIKQFEELKEKYKELSEKLATQLETAGVGTYFQDPTTKIVYSVVVPEGTFVSFKKIDFKRTKKETERSGTLSKKEAEEKGFVL